MTASIRSRERTAFVALREMVDAPIVGRWQNGTKRLIYETLEQERLLELIDLAAFNSVAAYGGIAAASRASGTPKATLSRRVRALEASLGVRLLERGTRLCLTEEGRALKGRTAPLLEGLWEAGEDLRSGHAPRGRLRVSAPVLFAQIYGGRLAADFCAAYPDVVLEIEIADRAVDLVAEEFDVALRVNPAPGSSLVGHRLLSSDYIVVAAPTIVMPLDGEEVRAVLLSREAIDNAWRIGRAGALVHTIKPRAVIRASSMLLIRDAVLAGAGAAAIPAYLVEDAIASGALHDWGRLIDRRVEVWALHTSRRFTSAKVTAFIEMLRHLMKQDHKGLAGVPATLAYPSVGWRL